MPPYAIALLSGAFGLFCIWMICKDVMSGVTISDGDEVKVEDNPAGYALTILFKMGLVVFCGAEIAFAFGMTGDPLVTLRTWLPFAG